MNYNKSTLLGRLVNNPEHKQITDSLSKISFILAVKRNYKRQDGYIDSDFIPICLLGKKAELGLQLLEKGMPVLICGRIQVRKYLKEEETRWMTEVIADTFQILKYKDKDKEIENNQRKKEIK